MAKKLSFLFVCALFVFLGVKALPAKTFAGYRSFLPMVINVADRPGGQPTPAGTPVVKPTATGTTVATARPSATATVRATAVATSTPVSNPTNFPTPNPNNCQVSGGITFCQNAWSKQPASSAQSSGDYVGDPGLVDPNHAINPGAVDPGWYQLRPGSPLYGKGVGASW